MVPGEEAATGPTFMDPTLEKVVVRPDELTKIGDDVKQEFKARDRTKHRWRLQKLNRLKVAAASIQTLIINFNHI